jgi:hypothetical protein
MHPITAGARPRRTGGSRWNSASTFRWSGARSPTPWRACSGCGGLSFPESRVPSLSRAATPNPWLDPTRYSDLCKPGPPQPYQVVVADRAGAPTASGLPSQASTDPRGPPEARRKLCIRSNVYSPIADECYRCYSDDEGVTLSNTPNDQRPDKMAVLLEVARRANWDAMHGPVHLRSGSPQRPAGLASRMAKRTSRVLASPWQPSSAGEQEAPLVALLVSRPSAHGSSRSRPAWHCSRRVPSVGASAFPRHWRQKLVVGDLTSDRGDVSPTAPG